MKLHTYNIVKHVLIYIYSV